MIFTIGMIIVFFTAVITAFVYGIYLWAIRWGKSYHSPGKLVSPLPVSVIIPAYNEGRVIEDKIKNLSEINYPSDLMEVVIIDDNSDDQTRQKALNAFKKYNIKGRVFTNRRRQGTNENYNKGFELASNDLIITTDADVIFDKDALLYILSPLAKEKKTGAVCGELIPWSSGQTLSTGIEAPYRDVFGKICGWESKLHSTYCFNGPLIGIKKDAVSRISSKKGASDTNIALMAIKKGFQSKYVPEAKFYEWIALQHNQQQRQKIRRASRLLESTWSARSCLFNPEYGKFGAIVLPLRFAMLFAIPSLALGSFLILIILAFMSNLFYGIILLIFTVVLFASAKWYYNIFSSFIWHQYYLFMGLLQMAKPSYLWDSIDRSHAANPVINKDGNNNSDG